MNWATLFDRAEQYEVEVNDVRRVLTEHRDGTVHEDDGEDDDDDV